MHIATGGNPRTVLIDEAAAILGVSRRTVYYRIREGRLRTIRTLGGSQRVVLASIEALLKEGRRVRVPGSGAVGVRTLQAEALTL